MIRDLIFDVGMHNGDDTAHYLERGYRVVAVEANPNLCEAARIRFADAIAKGRLTIESIGIAETRGSRAFYLCDAKSKFSAFSEAVAGRGGLATTPITVATRTLAELFATHGVPYYLKVDIEGQEGLCIDALEGLEVDELPVYVSVEAHGLDYLASLWTLGYRKFKVVDQLAHNYGPLPFSNENALARISRWLVFTRRRLHRRFSSAHAFAPGSSGPFGEETPGPWQDFETAAYEWLHFKHGQRHRGRINHRAWFDFHAKREVADAGE